MNTFSLGEVLSKAAQTTWKHKVLWILPAIAMIFSLLSLPVGIIFNPVSAPVLFPPLENVAEAPWFSLIGSGLNMCLSLVAGILGVVVSVVIIVGVVRVHHGAEKISLIELIQDSRPYLLRILGIALLFGFGFLVIWGGFVFIGVMFSVITLGLGFLCFMPLMLLLIPVIFLAYAWVELCYAAVVVENLDIFVAMPRAWHLLKQNFWSVVLMTLVIYLGIAMAVGVVALPIMVPIFVAPFSIAFSEGRLLSNQDQLRNILWLTSLCAAAYTPIYAIVQGAVMTFSRAAWTYTFISLSSQQQPPAMPAPEMAQGQ